MYKFIIYHVFIRSLLLNVNKYKGFTIYAYMLSTQVPNFVLFVCLYFKIFVNLSNTAR